jgi:hypothetical protein
MRRRQQGILVKEGDQYGQDQCGGDPGQYDGQFEDTGRGAFYLMVLKHFAADAGDMSMNAIPAKVLAGDADIVKHILHSRIGGQPLFERLMFLWGQFAVQVPDQQFYIGVVIHA